MSLLFYPVTPFLEPTAGAPVVKVNGAADKHVLHSLGLADEHGAPVPGPRDREAAAPFLGRVLLAQALLRYPTGYLQGCIHLLGDLARYAIERELLVAWRDVETPTALVPAAAADETSEQV